jgi:hypothetical protein
MIINVGIPTEWYTEIEVIIRKYLRDGWRFVDPGAEICQTTKAVMTILNIVVVTL